MDHHHPNPTRSHIETEPVDATPPTPEAEQAPSPPDDMPYEERAQLAGVDVNDEEELVTTDELIDTPSSAADRGAENSPLTRFGFVATAVGAIALVVWLLSGFFSAGQKQAQEETSGDPPLPEESADAFGEDDRMRAELALIEQDQAAESPRLARTPESQATASTPTTTAAAPSPEPTNPPAPTPTRAVPPPRPAAPPPAASPTLAASSTPAPEPTDPLEDWARLATAGASGTEVALTPEPDIQTPQGQAQAESAATPASDTALALPRDRVGDNPIALPGDLPSSASPQSGELVAANSPGARGIIQQRPVDDPSGRSTTVQQVAVGSAAAGEVVVPIIYAGGDFSSQGRFAVELTAPLRDINGRVALAAGTLLITQVSAVLDGNILRQQVIAIVYADAQGQVRQEGIEPGVLAIRGPDNQPLVAQVRNHTEGDRFGQDLLLGGLSALGNIGAVLNAPDAVTTATSGASGGTTRTQTTTTVTSGRDNNLWGAALAGFFTPISERLAQRWEAEPQATAEPYLYVPQGQTVSVFVNGVLEVAR
jgi:hypothetical protein